MTEHFFPVLYVMLWRKCTMSNAKGKLLIVDDDASV